MIEIKYRTHLNIYCRNKLTGKDFEITSVPSYEIQIVFPTRFEVFCDDVTEEIQIRLNQHKDNIKKNIPNSPFCKHECQYVHKTQFQDISILHKQQNSSPYKIKEPAGSMFTDNFLKLDKR